MSGWRAIRRYKLICNQIEILRSGELIYKDVDVLRNGKTVDRAGRDKDDSDEARTKLVSEKESALKDHVCSMVSLYVAACGSPAMIRLIDNVFPNAGVVGLVGAVVGLSQVVEPFANTYLQPRTKMTKPRTERKSQ